MVQAESDAKLAEFEALGVVAEFDGSWFVELLQGIKSEAFPIDIKMYYNHSLNISEHTVVNWSFPCFPTFEHTWMSFIIGIG